jgi:hypothetical protein
VVALLAAGCTISVTPAVEPATSAPVTSPGSSSGAAATPRSPVPASPSVSSPGSAASTPSAPVSGHLVIRGDDRSVGDRTVQLAVARLDPAGLPSTVVTRVDRALADELDRGLRQADESEPPASVVLDVTQVPTVPGLVAARYEWSYNFGGAHPTGATTFVVADLRDGTVVGARRLVRADALAALAAESRGLLKARFGDGLAPDQLAEGTKPTYDSFSTLLPGPDGLHVVFGEYQVGPYAIGRPEIVIPWSKARAWLPADSPLKR